jgi:hypothetical protein
MTEKIKSCPFCGSKKIQICRTNPDACWIRCDRCWGETESDPTRQGAIRKWNREKERTFDTKIVDDDDLGNYK